MQRYIGMSEIIVNSTLPNYQLYITLLLSIEMIVQRNKIMSIGMPSAGGGIGI